MNGGQFYCAFCKKLNNCLVPYIPNNSTQSSVNDTKSEKKSDQVDDKLDWLNWIQNPNFENNSGGTLERSSQEREVVTMSTDVSLDNSNNESSKHDNSSEIHPQVSQPLKKSNPTFPNRFASLLLNMKSFVKKWSSPENQNSLVPNNRNENASNDSRISAVEEMDEDSTHDLGVDDNEDRKVLCLRFLREMCETINIKLKMNIKDLDYSHHVDGFYSDEIVKSIECCMSSMGFSISMDCIENSAEKSNKFDNKKYLDKVIHAIGESLDVFNIFNPVLDDVCNAFRGIKVDQSKKRYQSNSLLLTSAPLLSRPIFDTVILCITIIMFKQRKSDTPVRGIFNNLLYIYYHLF